MNLIASKNKATRWRTGRIDTAALLGIEDLVRRSRGNACCLIFAFLAGTSPELTFGQQQQVSSVDVDAPAPHAQ